MTRLHTALVLVFVKAFIFVAASAQNPDFSQGTPAAKSLTSPIEGSGHDYIKMLSETVDPSNGYVRLNINFPVPESRGFTVPFGVAYDSNSEQQLKFEKYGYVWADH